MAWNGSDQTTRRGIPAENPRSGFEGSRRPSIPAAPKGEATSQSLRGQDVGRKTSDIDGDKRSKTKDRPTSTSTSHFGTPRQASGTKDTKALSREGESVIFAHDGMPALELWLEDETIWITQRQMASLFGCSEENIRLHVKNIYAIGELDEGATSKDFLEVRLEGRRRVSRKFSYYNLDMAISVGYRVNSIRGVRFRQWATSVLKEYLLRGSVRDRRLAKLEGRMTAAERSIHSILYTLMPALPENREPIGFNVKPK